jgi:hypothetical protein
VSTFGITTAGTNADLTSLDGTAIGSAFALTEAGTVSKLSASIANPGAASNFYGFLYQNTAGEAGAWIASTPFTTIGAGAAKAWVDFTFASGVPLSAGTYWLVICGAGGGSGTAIAYSTATGSATLDYNTAFNPASPSNPFAKSGAVDYTLSINATYTPSAGAVRHNLMMMGVGTA